MKLDAGDRMLAVPHAHDLAIVALGGDLERFGQARSLDDQRVITSRRQGARKPRENTFAAMRDRRQLAVHDASRPHDATAKRRADRLMAEADAEDRYLTREALDQRHRN